MAKFPISFTNNPSEPRKLKTPKRLKKSYNDTPFQEILAYSSYYVLVFVAVCMFAPTTVAYAANSIKNIFV